MKHLRNISIFLVLILTFVFTQWPKIITTTFSAPALELKAPIKRFDPLRNTPKTELPLEVRLEVPFTSQAPFSKWVPPFDEACEEASLIMLEYYLLQEELTPDMARLEIELMTDWATKEGFHIDVSVQELARIATKYYERKPKIYTGNQVTLSAIKRLLHLGYPVIVPAAGQDLKNPHFQNGGPPYHMLVIVGYDQENFYAHDPGTRFGESYAYPIDRLYNAIHNWNGSKTTIRTGPKAIMVLEDERITPDYVRK